MTEKSRLLAWLGGSLILFALIFALFAGERGAESGPSEPADGTDHQAQRLLAARCTVCHSLDLIVQQRLDREHWGTIVKKMSSWGAHASESEQESLAAYLASRYHPDAGPLVIEESAH